jgi:outer membrane receptor for ferrienterochelin and colicin
LTFLGIVGVDDSGTTKEDALRDNESFYGGLDTTEYSVGINWLSTWSKQGYSNTSISHSSIKYNYDFYNTVTEKLARKGKDLENAFTLRNVNFYKFSNTHMLTFGIEVKHLITKYDYFLASYTDVLGNEFPDIQRKIEKSTNIYASFLNHTWNPFLNFTINTGIRVEHFSYNRDTYLSPRFSLSFNLSNRLSLNGAIGVFHQHLPLILLTKNKNFKKLKTPVAYHFVFGVHYLVTENTKLSLEIYDKEYNNFPLDPIQPSLFIFDEVFYGGYFSNHEKLVDSGRARSYGIEFMIQKKLARKIYGLISASYFRALYRDLNGIWRNRVYDNKYILNIEGGYKLNKYWEFSLKWNYAGGTPHTPFDIEKSHAINNGIFDWSRINAERLPPYHTLNIRMDKRFYFSSTNLIIYLSIWNLYNRRNIFSYYWNTIERKPAKVYGWGILPILGIEFEF